MGSEMYKNKFFKHYEDNKGVSVEIQQRDEPIFYELEDVPTNYPQRKVVRSMLSRNLDWEDEMNGMMNKMLVPVFSRKRGRTMEYFGLPFFILLDREEQKDFYAILAKVCERYQSLTTSRLFEDTKDSDEENSETSGVATSDEEGVVVNGEGELVEDGKRVRDNDEKEGYVDVRMEDVSEEETRKKPKNPYSRSNLDKLKELFNMKIAVKASHGADRTSVLTGWSDSNVSGDLVSRIRLQTPPPPTPPMRKPYRSDESEEDYDLEEEPLANAPEPLQESDDDGQFNDRSPYKKSSFTPMKPGFFYGNKKANNKKSKLYREQSPGSAPATPVSPEEQAPLLKLGEALVCDWDEDGYDSIFGARSRDDMRGYPLWDDIPLYHDAELEAKRQLRDIRRKRGTHLEDCLAEFAKEEILSETDPWYCPRCKVHRRASKKFELWKSPDILVIHLKRFSSSRISRDKIDALIEFPIEALDLTDRVGNKEEGKEQIYDLFAVDNHYGGLGGGHYTAYAKNYEDGKWYHFDGASLS